MLQGRNSSAPLRVRRFLGRPLARGARLPDGSLVVTASGRTIELLFDTDPGGPSTTLYLGGLVGMLSPDGAFSVSSHTGGTV